jgi:hypothetical protein
MCLVGPQLPVLLGCLRLVCNWFLVIIPRIRVFSSPSIQSSGHRLDDDLGKDCIRRPFIQKFSTLVIHQISPILALEIEMDLALKDPWVFGCKTTQNYLF